MDIYLKKIKEKKSKSTVSSFIWFPIPNNRFNTASEINEKMCNYMCVHFYKWRLILIDLIYSLFLILRTKKRYR